jgi:hypothetical protein
VSAYDKPGQAESVAAMLRFDALAAAEVATGKSYKDDAATGVLGLLGHMAACEAREKALLDADVTVLSNEVARYERILLAEGFSLVHGEPFLGTGYAATGGEAETPEVLCLWWHPDGLLLRYDTFGGAGYHVNSSTVYFNWRSTVAADWHRIERFSGHWKEGVAVGSFDAREGLRLSLHSLRSRGGFVSPWIERPWMWLLHYMDTKAEGYSHEAITGRRLTALPEHVLAAIGGAS